MAVVTGLYGTSFSFYSTVTRRRHDVFLSFRGEDTRNSITQKLYDALRDAGIPTFKDDVNLAKGGEIAYELLKAIQMSRIALVIFSRNYATSRWCLDELVKIIDCKHQAGQVVLPVFYDVDPDDVLNQTNSYEMALKKQEERAMLENWEENKVERWKATLTEAASSDVGWDVQNLASWHQSKFIKEIVKHIMGRRQDAHMTASIFPQNVVAAQEYVNLLLSVISDDVLIIGISGAEMTTIAKAVYNDNFEHFESSSYIQGVSQAAGRPDGLLALQKQFLSDVLMGEKIEVKDVESGTETIKNALHSKRVLAVLDNVNKLDQLNALARSRDWFGPGSRILITTKDPQLLNVIEVDDVYGTQGIQIIKDQFKQNLQEIGHLVEYIQRFRIKAHEQELCLMSEIEREREKNVHQAELIANLQGKLTQPGRPTLPNKVSTRVDCQGGFSGTSTYDSEHEDSLICDLGMSSNAATEHPNELVIL